MDDENPARAEENTIANARENQRSISQHAHRSTGWAQQTTSQKSGEARVNCPKNGPDLKMSAYASRS